MHLITRIVHEAHRRSLWQVLSIYLVGSWIGYEVIHGLTEGLGLPDWVPGFAVVLFIIGLPIVMATAFIQEGLPGTRRVPDPALDALTLVGETPSGPDPDEPRTPLAAGHHLLFTWQRAILGGIVAFLLLGVTASSYVGMRESGFGPFGSLVAKGALDARDRILISRFAAREADADLAEMLTQAFRVDFAQSTMLTVVEPRTIREALERMGRDPAERLDADLARELALREGIKATVVGEINRAGAGYVLSASLVATQDGAVLATFRENAADSTEVLAAVDRLSKKLRERIGESLRTIRANQPLAAVTTPSLEALRKYTQGVEALDRDIDYELAISLLREAIAIDSMFGMAWRKLSVAYGNSGGSRDLAIDAATRAFALRDRMTAAERDHATAFYHMNVTRDLRAAIAAYRSLLDLYPADYGALNNIAILYHRSNQHDEAAARYRMAIASDSTMRNAYTNLVGELLELGRPDEAGLLLDLHDARFGPSETSIRRRFFVATARRDFDEALQVTDSMRNLSRTTPSLRAFRAYAVGGVADVHGRLRDADRQWTEAAALDSARGNAAMTLMAPIWDAMRSLWLRQDAERAVRELDAALEQRPLQAYSATSRPYFDVANLYAVAGRAERARELLGEYEREVPAHMRASDAQARRWIDVNLALGSGDADAAIGSVRALMHDEICKPCVENALATAFLMKAEADSAIVYYERYIVAPSAELIWEDARLAVSHERLADLYAERNDVDRARLHAARFVELWQDADPDLQPRVRAKQDLLARLGADRRQP
jgi:eukaryotic-like serine/threonine-protein kinase